MFNETSTRLIAFLAIFGLLAIVELVSPRLERDELRGAWKSKRWISNLSLLLLSSIVMRLVFPAAAVGTAIWASTNQIGLFPYLSLPPWVAGIIAFVVLDFAVWFEHLASHKIPLLWRIHRVHHVDTGLDVTTGLRFHPAEILLSMLWKAGVVIALGAPPLAVLVFEVVLNGCAMFTHSNIKLPAIADRFLRRLIVTPDMHRVHHSVIPQETDSNYGFNLVIWDRLFRTYIDQPKLGHEKMEIGLKQYRSIESTGLLRGLLLPFAALSRQKKPTGK